MKTKNIKNDAFKLIIVFLLGCIFASIFVEIGIDELIKRFDSILDIAVVVICLGVPLILIFFIFQKQIYFKILGLKEEDLEITNDSVNDILKAVKDGKYETVTERVISLFTAGKLVFSNWVIRTWIFRGVQILFLSYAGLIGSHILLKQNKIIEQQSNIIIQNFNDEKIRYYREIIYSKEKTGIREIALRDYLDLTKDQKKYYLNLKNANLSDFNLRNTKLKKIDFSGANLIPTNLSSCIIDSCDFKNVYLTETNINNTTLINCDLSHLKFGAPSKVNYYLNSENEIYGIYSTRLAYSKKKTISSPYEILYQNLTIENCLLHNVDFSNCNLNHLKFNNNNWGKNVNNKCKFNGAIIIDTELPQEIRAMAIKDGAIYSRDQLKKK